VLDGAEPATWYCQATDGDRFCTLVAGHDRGDMATMHEQHGSPWEPAAQQVLRNLQAQAASPGNSESDRAKWAAMAGEQARMIDAGEFGELEPASTDARIAELDAAPDMSDGRDPRTWRDVYDSGLITDADIARAHSYLPAAEAARYQAAADRIGSELFPGIDFGEAAR
jgi:hypothetical protein